MRRAPLMTALMLAVAALAAAVAQAAPAAPADGELAQKAWAVFQANCVGCHGNGKRSSRQATIDQDSWARLVDQQKKVVPGQPEQSHVYTRMIDPQSPMPPRQVRQRPSAEDIDTVRQWIAAGARDWAGAAQAPKAAPQAPPVNDKPPTVPLLPAAPPNTTPAPAPPATTPAAELPLPPAPSPAPAVPAPAAEITAGEIMIEGVVLEAVADGTSLTLQATRFTLPSKRSAGINPPKAKLVIVDANTARQGGNTAALQAGMHIQVIGADNGTGSPLPARVITVLP